MNEAADAEGESTTARGTKGTSSLTWALLALVIVPVAFYTVQGAFVSQTVLESARSSALSYDDHFDPVVVRNGVVSAGPRLPRSEVDGRLVLVDPDETVTDEELEPYSELILVRRTTLIRRQVFREQTYQVSSIQDFLGVDDIVVDGAHLAEAIERHSHWFLIVGLGIGLFLALVDIVLLTIYALVAASAASLLPRTTMISAFPVALAVSLLTIPVSFVLNWLEMPPGACLGILLWSGFTVGGTLLGVGFRRD